MSTMKPGFAVGWAVVNHLGHIWVWTASDRRRDALRKLSEALPNSVNGQPAKWLKSNQCRCVRVTITEDGGA